MRSGDSRDRERTTSVRDAQAHPAGASSARTGNRRVHRSRWIVDVAICAVADQLGRRVTGVDGAGGNSRETVP